MAKLALLIGVSEYEPGLNPLPGSVLDVDALRRVLVHPNMGGFAEADITTLKNPQRQEMEDAIYRLFADRKKDDLLLLYFSGHGIKDENSRLYLATRTTRKENGRLFNPSAVAAAYLHERINDSKSQRQVIILDCCFSGAIAQGMTVKDDGTVDIEAVLGGRGRAILTSSTSVEYSFGSDGSGYADSGLSVYTRFLVEGIETGAADIGGDGWISVEELHEYASRQVKTVSPAMTPKFYPVEEGYKINLAKSPQNDPKLNYRKEVQERAKQGGGKFSVFARNILEDKRRKWGLSPEEAEAIQTEVLQPYREYEQKLQDYEQALREAATDEYPFSRQTEQDLQEYRQHLDLRAEDWQAIETRVLPPCAPTSEKAEVNLIPPQAATSSPPAFSPTSLPSSLTAEELFKQAGEKQNAGDKQGAITDYTEAIRLKSDFADAYNNRGNAKYALGDKQGAITDYTEAIRLKSDFATAYNSRGVAKFALGDKQGAITDYTEAIRLKSDFATAYNSRGFTKSALGDKQGAITDYTEAIRLKPDDATAYYNRGFTKSALGDKQGAITDYTEAIRLKSDFADAYNSRGVAKSALGDKQGAITDYTEAIRLKPDDAIAYNNRGSAKYALGDKQGAITDYTEAIRLKPDDAIAYNNRGSAKDDLGDKQGAITDYTEAIRLKPGFATAYNNRGLAKSALGDKQGAVKDYQEAAKLYQQQGKTEDYRDALNQVEKLEKENKGFWGRLFS